MIRLNKQEFQAWAYDDLVTNTTCGLLAEHIVATSLGIHDTKRVEWDHYDLEIDRAGEGVGIEVKSAAYVQTWEQAQVSEIAFRIRPAQGWDACTNTYADSAKRSAAVYVVCLLEGEDRERIDPLDVAQWTFYVLSSSKLDRQVPTRKTIRLGRLNGLGAHPCNYDGLKAAIDAAAADVRGS